MMLRRHPSPHRLLSDPPWAGQEEECPAPGEWTHCRAETATTAETERTMYSLRHRAPTGRESRATEEGAWLVSPSGAGGWPFPFPVLLFPLLPFSSSRSLSATPFLSLAP